MCFHATRRAVSGDYRFKDHIRRYGSHSSIRKARCLSKLSAVGPSGRIAECQPYGNLASGRWTTDQGATTGAPVSESHARYSGVFPVAPTTFTESGDLDLESQKRCIDFMIDAGSNGICILANF